MYDFDTSYDLDYNVLQNTRSADQRTPNRYIIIKRLSDIVCSLLALILLAPLFLALAIAVKFSSDGKIIYRHKRIGYHGKEIEIYKFRTMVKDANNIYKHFTPEQCTEFEKCYKLSDDPRITRLGRMLRRTSLDELPQLLNILSGEMSLVGPRPIVKEELQKYGQYAEAYLSVKPGLTGMWQVHGRSDTTYQERVLMDFNYVRNQSLIVDLKLILKTFGVVLSRKGAC